MCLTALLMPVLSLGKDDPAAMLKENWHEIAAKAKLSAAAIKHLEREKVLMTKDELLQCYQAYMPGYMTSYGEDRDRWPELPYFITTDAMFQAYAWCLQKGTAKMETAHAGQMREYLQVLLKSLSQVDEKVEGDASHILKAKEMATFVVGVAALLMDAKVEIEPESLKREVELEAQRVRKAEGEGWPARLKATPEDSSRLDYTLFKPVGLYEGDLLMERYFRAVRWLQLAPFRMASDEHMLAAAMLSLSHNPKRLRQLKLEEKAAKLFEEREARLIALAGPPGGAGVVSCVVYTEAGNKAAKKATEWVQKARENIEACEREAAGVAITSMPRNDSPADAAAHLILTSVLTDAMLLEKLSQAKGETYFPDALSIASWLGSDYAAGQEQAEPRAEEIRDKAGKWLDASVKAPSLHQEGLMLLQRLVQRPPDNAPAFMKSRAWQAKSCQTALAAWAQSRHVWALQARPQYSVGAGFREWPAFVEPAPHFFVGLSGLCRRAASLLQVPESEKVVNQRIACRLRQMADDAAQAVGKEPTIFDTYFTTINMLLEAGVKHPEGLYSDSNTVTEFTRILRESAQVVERGEATAKHPVAQKLREHLANRQKVPFDELAENCQRLARLVHKQAKELPATKDETEWLLIFGVILASFSDCHFTSPVDNVPKGVRVFSNPELGKALTVGIGRPRFLYVLYPWKGKEVLCRGAVLPYLERHELQPFTDEEWRRKLHDEKAPAIQPGWVSPLMAE